ncbi:MAG: nucleotidyltransferase substrate binding protein [Deltaproteobacteria bacterium]|nr:nucleotidyltransferase substrate binding protein [Deltaproteobacteria bacterium]
MEKERLYQTIDAAKDALKALRDVVAWVEECTDLTERSRRIDAVAKRFEVAFEYGWKALQAAARWKGEEVYGPRDAIQAAHAHGWLADADQWAGFLEARNSGVHDYFGLGSEEYFAVARDFLPQAEAVISAIKIQTPP